MASTKRERRNSSPSPTAPGIIPASIGISPNSQEPEWSKVGPRSSPSPTAPSSPLPDSSVLNNSQERSKVRRYSSLSPTAPHQTVLKSGTRKEGCDQVLRAHQEAIPVTASHSHHDWQAGSDPEVSSHYLLSAEDQSSVLSPFAEYPAIDCWWEDIRQDQRSGREPKPQPGDIVERPRRGSPSLNSSVSLSSSSRSGGYVSTSRDTPRRTPKAVPTPPGIKHDSRPTAEDGTPIGETTAARFGHSAKSFCIVLIVGLILSLGTPLIVTYTLLGAEGRAPVHSNSRDDSPMHHFKSTDHGCQPQDAYLRRDDDYHASFSQLDASGLSHPQQGASSGLTSDSCFCFPQPRPLLNPEQLPLPSIFWFPLSHLEESDTLVDSCFYCNASTPDSIIRTSITNTLATACLLPSSKRSPVVSAAVKRAIQHFSSLPLRNHHEQPRQNPLPYYRHGSYRQHYPAGQGHLSAEPSLSNAADENINPDEKDWVEAEQQATPAQAERIPASYSTSQDLLLELWQILQIQQHGSLPLPRKKKNKDLTSSNAAMSEEEQGNHAEKPGGDGDEKEASSICAKGVLRVVRLFEIWVEGEG